MQIGKDFRPCSCFYACSISVKVRQLPRIQRIRFGNKFFKMVMFPSAPPISGTNFVLVMFPAFIFVLRLLRFNRILWRHHSPEHFRSPSSGLEILLGANQGSYSFLQIQHFYLLHFLRLRFSSLAKPSIKPRFRLFLRGHPFASWSEGSRLSR